ncbi:hypothetical protein [Clostridium cochlearium]|uniref:Uncharacterized protein n=1 Tax=Clostridium cochlearium TaxID=1494 RepID=A0A7Y3V5G3_CLOCO|nr:hypothetical protein [Clostridium cochlearium]MBU5269434.1 hypothetical protein [Clostridium cochlearium]NOH14836.1 hypothetical protein [Clostridium cochlearium]
MTRQVRKIKNVVVHYPTPENQEEFDKKAARAVAKVLFNMYPIEVIEQIIEEYKDDNL